MWIFTTKGFLSVVQHNSSPEYFQVKSRIRDPLEELWPDCEIQVIDWADYRFRVNIHKEEAVRVIMKLLKSVDYTNFKQECFEMPEYQRSLGGIWNIMYHFQESMKDPGGLE